MSTEVAVSSGCAWFGPVNEAPIRMVPTEEHVIPADPDSPLVKREARVCPACGSFCDVVDSDTFNRTIDADTRVDFRLAREWAVGKHFPSVDEMYELYVTARSTSDNPVALG